MKRIITFTALLLVSSPCLSQTSQSPPPQASASVRRDDIIMTASLPREVAPGTAVTLRIILKNDGKRDLELHCRGPYWDFDLELRDAKRNRVPFTQFGKRIDGDARTAGGSGLEITIKPGMESEATLNIARVFDLSLDGEYHLRITRRGSVRIEKLTFHVQQLMP
jgi:hypothetical protein